MSDYERIATAIDYIHRHVRQQPTLSDIAAHLNLSPYHFQRLFSRWAGVTPKRFLQALTLEHARTLLRHGGSLLDASTELGLSSGSRLYDHFVKLEAATPGEYKSGGHTLHIDWGVHDSPFGALFIAMTGRGICRMAFLANRDPTPELAQLNHTWPRAEFVNNCRRTASVVTALFNSNGPLDRPLSLWVSGTNFQINVWKALLKIKPGTVASYTQLAQSMGQDRAARAVGTAVAANPVALLIPCHRVIQKSGQIGDYRWGSVRKHALLTWEAARYSED